MTMTLDRTPEYPYLFSVCTLVTHHDEYAQMVESFERAGFSQAQTQFLSIDNSKGNIHDGYSGLNRFLGSAQGQYIIVCHQDIELRFDDRATLLARIEELERLDPHWAVAGNAGYGEFNTKLYCISDPWGENQRHGALPARTKTLDENFVLVKNEANLALSHDLRGFHLYATDLCNVAHFLGWHAYVIDFHLYHKSGGSCNEDFRTSKRAFMDKYSRTLHSMSLRTPCAIMFITSSRVWNRIINNNLFYSLRKRFGR
ncbi:MAG: hypothetical protein KU37_11955 [Sulfuricurvum sp. PC08-66]|nr:MAG: hypothetical protein KU37_11955 [Sulfuricurvum sp. PC08-66]